MQEISPEEAATLMQQDDVVLIDVREPAELEAAAVAGALHIPMNDVPARIDEIDKEKTVLVLCHLGGRSAQVAMYLLSNGYENVINVAGGISAWAADHDPSVVKDQ